MIGVRVVLDTDVVVAAMRSPRGASAAILRAARQGRVTLLASVPLALEYEAVASRAEHRLAAGLTEREVEDLSHRGRGHGRAGDDPFSLAAAAS